MADSIRAMLGGDDLRKRPPSVAVRYLFAAVILASCVGSSACLIFCIACEGYLGAAGEVYEWVDAPPGAKGFAVIDASVPGQHRTTPLAGSQVLLEPWTPRDRPAADGPALSRRRTVSDNDGRFRLGGAVRPGHYRATLSVRAAGFHQVEHVFDHNRQTAHKVAVLLVREK